jgi:NAD(P)-dependent dehydrogenase (short-subunit alcohol dehydrogenase family)
MTNYSNFAGRTALVTGGASGLGRAMAEALAATGASLVLFDLNHAQARHLASDLKAKHSIRVEAVERGPAPFGLASHADCAQGVTAIAAFCRGSHGRRYRAKRYSRNPLICVAMPPRRARAAARIVYGLLRYIGATVLCRCMW